MAPSIAVPTERELRFTATKSSGDVSALLLLPRDAECLFVLAHGAGAGMRHPFMAGVAAELARHQVATFRYQFPYIESGRRSPNPPPVLQATVRAAVSTAASEAGHMPMIAGGKSLGGRMTSQAAAKEPLRGVSGLVFLGFPLHAPGRPGASRGEHLQQVTIPMLFLQGTRDRLADLDHLRPLCKSLGKRATLHVMDDADHSFKMPKRAGRSDAEVLSELATTTAHWAAGLS